MTYHLYYILETFNLLKEDRVITKHYECSKSLTKQVPKNKIQLKRFNGKNYRIFIPPKKVKK